MYFQTSHINFFPILLGRSFGSKLIPRLRISPRTFPLHVNTTPQLQRIQDVVNFGDQVLALVGMHLLVLNVCVLLELASYQPLSLH